MERYVILDTGPLGIEVRAAGSLVLFFDTNAWLLPQIGAFSLESHHHDGVLRQLGFSCYLKVLLRWNVERTD